MLDSFKNGEIIANPKTIKDFESVIEQLKASYLESQEKMDLQEGEMEASFVKKFLEVQNKIEEFLNEEENEKFSEEFEDDLKNLQRVLKNLKIWYRTLKDGDQFLEPKNSLLKIKGQIELTLLYFQAEKLTGEMQEMKNSDQLRDAMEELRILCQKYHDKKTYSKQENLMMETYAKGLYLLSIEQDTWDREETVEELSRIYEAYKSTVGWYASALFTIMSGSSLKRQREIVEKLEILYEKHKEKIAELYAESLNVWMNNQNLEERVQTLKTLEGLYKYHREEVVQAYAAGLLKVAKKESLTKSERRAEELKHIYKKGSTVGRQYALLLLHLLQKQKLSDCKKSIDELKKIFDAERGSTEEYYLKGLVKFIERQNLSDAMETMKILKSLYEGQNDYLPVVQAYAWGLSELLKKQKFSDETGNMAKLKEIKGRVSDSKILDIYTKSILNSIRAKYLKKNVDLTEELNDLKELYHNEQNDQNAVWYTLAKLYQFNHDFNTTKRCDLEILREIRRMLDKIQICDKDSLENMINILESWKNGRARNYIFKKILKKFSKNISNKACEKLLGIFETLKGGRMKLVRKVEDSLIGLFFSYRKIYTLLSVDPEQQENLGHYSKLQRINNFITDGSGNHFWLSNSYHMNDPKEGKLLLKFLSSISKQAAMFDEFDISADTSVYLFCLTTATDLLPMWMQYGDKGEGCCFVFDASLFDDSTKTIDSDSIDYDSGSQDQKIHSPSNLNESTISEDEDGDNKKIGDCYCPYHIAYLAENGSNWEIFIHGNKGTMKAQTVKKLLENIEFYIRTAIILAESSSFESEIRNFIHYCLGQIRFLFKSDKYSYEQEVRLLVSIPIESDRIIFEDTNGQSVPKLHIESERPVVVKKLILGPKVSDFDDITPYIYNCNRNIQVELSEIHYR